jgi:hydrogenase nickel incorporation protein HypA/HybF
MHELSIALSILDGVEEEMRNHPAAKVGVIHLRIGALAGIVPEALISAYELAREQSPFPASRLEIDEVPIAVFCKSCGAERSVRSPTDLRCVDCNSPASEIRQGREIQLFSLELEESPG